MSVNNNQDQELNQADQEKKLNNTIQRCPHDKENPYVMSNKLSIQDKSLSWGATGLLIYLLSLKKDWIVHKDELSNRKKNGRDATRTYFDELIEKRYILDIQLYKGNLTVFITKVVQERVKNLVILIKRN